MNGLRKAKIKSSFYHLLWSHVQILDSDWLKTVGYETTTLSCLKETF